MLTEIASYDYSQTILMDVTNGCNKVFLQRINCSSCCILSENRIHVRDGLHSMLDIKWIRSDPDALDRGLLQRGLAPVAARVLALDKARREAQNCAQEIQSRRNKLAKQIGTDRNQGKAISSLLTQVISEKDAQIRAEALVSRLTDELEGPQGLLMTLPNLPARDVPDGLDSSANVELRRSGTLPVFTFKPREHVTIGTALGLMDFKRATQLSGARFVILKGALARLERALTAFMLDMHTTEFGYVEINPPALVRDEALLATGQLPKFAADLFRTDSGHWLIPTAEVPLTNLVAGEILDEATLPLRYTATSSCFRSEAGAAGKDTRGMIRQHQFTKVELVSVAHPDQSEVEHQRMTACAETVLKRLELPYRVMELCAGDMGFAACRTYDIEVWLPGQRCYREISSCSNCGDFQARRMKARFHTVSEKKITRFVHTLNGSGLAVGRTLVAILENFQQADGTVALPDILHPYMNGLKVIVPYA